MAERVNHWTQKTMKGEVTPDFEQPFFKAQINKLLPQLDGAAQAAGFGDWKSLDSHDHDAAWQVLKEVSANSMVEE